VLVGVLAALAVVLGSFWLFCAATFFGGAYAVGLWPLVSALPPRACPLPSNAPAVRKAGRDNRPGLLDSFTGMRQAA
jgi:hypothetical protein